MRLKGFIGVIGLLLALAGLHAVGAKEARRGLEAGLTAIFGRKAVFQSAAAAFPFGVRLSEVTIPGRPGGNSSVYARTVTARLHLPGILSGRPRLDLELEGLKMFLERDPARLLHLPVGFEGIERLRNSPLGRLRVREGQILLIDRAVSPTVFCDFRDLDLQMRPERRPPRLAFTVSAGLQGEAGERLGRLEAQGELQPAALAEVRLSLRYEPMGRLSAYLKELLGTAPSEGALHLKSSLRLLEQELLADNEVEATGVLFPTDEPTLLGPPGNRLVDLLKNPDGAVHLSFSCRGRLGGPIGWSNLMEATLREALRQALARNIQKTLTEAEPPRSMEEAIRRGMESLGR